MRPMLTLRAIVFGLLLMLYFGICNVIGVADQIELRFFNFAILGVGLYTTFRTKATRGKEFGMKYFSGLKEGLIFSIIASAVFSFTFFMYLWLGDFALVEDFVAKGVINESVTALHLSALIIVENVVAGFMLTFVMMQYFKYNWKQEKDVEYS